MTGRITLDRYVYEDIYPAFKAATDEKEITANLNREFLNYLAALNLVLSGDTPAVVADIGCGPCDTLIKYLTGVRFAPGFIVRATDYIPEYADPERGEAVRNLAAARERNTIKLAGFSLRAGDAFAGNLLGLLSAPQADAGIQGAFRVVFASHMMYHAESATEVQRVIGDIANNLLDREGVSILYHIANRPGTFQEFRARFGSRAEANRESDTGAVTIDDPPAQIAAACAAMGLPLYQTEFITRLNFGVLRDDERRAFKNPDSYDALAEANPQAYEDLKRLYFVVQRAPLEFAADRSATGLAAFIDQIFQVIDANHGVLPSAEQMQVLSRSDAPAILAATIPEALAAAIKSST
ncbi:MAG TPA: hypothetical protein VJN94_05205 [Candidatus Binataceae bacterium]|nr:hypothetical protein [Candidatus Binataceae bacterium]